MSAGDGEVTAHDLMLRGHSYRNYQPREFIEAAENSGLKAARDELRTVEAGRLWELLEALSTFFFRLDRDEKDTYTRRNPGVVRWMSVWNELQELNPFETWRDLGERLLVGSEQHTDAAEVPRFVRQAPAERSLLVDMKRRRRSYRNWAPSEFYRIVERHGKRQARDLIERIEAGRFEAMLKPAFYFFVALDPDERRDFAFRNPGLTDWLSTWGYLEDLIHGAQLYPWLESDDSEFFFVPHTVEGNPEREGGLDEFRDRIRDQLGP